MYPNQVKKKYYANDPFYVEHSEFRDPISFINKLRQPSDPVSRFIRTHLTTGTIQRIDEYDGRSEVSKRLLNNIWGEINFIASKPAPWNIPDYFATDTSIANKYQWTLANPSYVEDLPGLNMSAWRFNVELFRTFYEHDLVMRPASAKVWRFIRNLFSGWDSLVFDCVLLLLLYFISSPTSLKVSFADLRGVDQALTLISSEMGFKRKRQDARGIAYRRWGLFGWLFRHLGGMHVRVDGNVILLTSGNLIIQRAKRLFKLHIIDD